nr:MAG TPA: hypothetical protein [Bacteriophage sp.]
MFVIICYCYYLNCNRSLPFSLISKIYNYLTLYYYFIVFSCCGLMYYLLLF